MAKQKPQRKIPHVSPDAAQKMVQLPYTAIKDFEGQFDEMESAIGMYFVGQLVGWKVLVLIHNKRTIKKYEQFLGINIREAFEPVGPMADKSLGYEIAQKLNAFWKAVSGEVSIERRREVQKA